MAKSKKSKHSTPLKGETTPRTVFVCVRDRHGKGRSCAASGSRALLSDARALLEGENIGPEELSVRPTGCLGLCKKGPVCLAVAGQAALDRKPPKLKKKKAHDGQSVLISISVEPRDLRPILREALLQAD